MRPAGLAALVAALALAPAASAWAASTAKPPIRMILVGDSTMAPRSGYGDALCADMEAGVTCVNTARGGRSTLSFRADGSWKGVMDLLRTKGAWTTTYVLIQFGHNDQPGRPGKSTDFATEYMPNLARYVAEVRSTGAQPILVSPLTRRMFGKDGLLKDSLSLWAAGTQEVARDTETPFLDLHRDSMLMVQDMGPDKALALGIKAQPDADGTPPKRPVVDYTHLGPQGATLTAKVVERELKTVVPALGRYISDKRQ